MNGNRLLWSHFIKIKGLNLISITIELFLSYHLSQKSLKKSLLCKSQFTLILTKFYFLGSTVSETNIHVKPPYMLISYLNENRNNRAITLLLVIDFCEAFDLVDSRKLLRKLFHYDFDNSALSIISNYFTDKFQSVKYDKKLSPLMEITLGVPRVVFFLIMINDLAYSLDLMCKLFADDTTLGDVDKDLNTFIFMFIKKLQLLLDWC